MVEKELNCFIYCLKEAIKKVKQGDIAGAEVYIENARRSLKEVKKAKGATQ